MELFPRELPGLDVGYGCGLALTGLALLFGCRNDGDALVIAHAALLAAYGARYALLMAWHGQRFPELAAQYAERTAHFGVLLRFRSVLLVSALCALEVSPAVCHAQVSPCGCQSLAWAAIGTAAYALGVESVADWQKAAITRRRSSDEPCIEGLYRGWRHPHYAADMLFWLCVYAAGLPALLPGACDGCAGLPRGQRHAAVRVLPLLLSTAGLAAQLRTTLSACARAEASQMERYGARQSFRLYRRRSGALLPRLGRLPQLPEWRVLPVASSVVGMVLFEVLEVTLPGFWRETHRIR